MTNANLKSMLNAYWHIDRIKKNLNDVATLEGTEAAQNELYNYYSQETFTYREFKQYTLDQIHEAFKELLGGIINE